VRLRAQYPIGDLSLTQSSATFLTGHSDQSEQLCLGQFRFQKSYKSFRYQAESWTTSRRIVAKVEHHQGELFPLRFYRDEHVPARPVGDTLLQQARDCRAVDQGRKQATHWTRLSCHRFCANEVRLQISVLAYNLGNLWRRLVLPTRVEMWSLTSLQQRLVKTGGRQVRHARYYWLLLAEGHLTRRLFRDMLDKIWALPVPTA
jgi:hypothetical protein